MLKQDDQAHSQAVFVPLCGKSDDMVWLADHMKVVGAELSEIACRDFFAEKGIDVTPKADGEFWRYQHENVSLYQGDFFNLSAERFDAFDWIYDRAALIALPDDMQQQYVKQLCTYLTANTRLFLISLEFPQAELSGPPFALFQPDIERLFSGYNVQCIASHDLDDKIFAQRAFNVSYLREKLYIITHAKFS